MEWIRRKPNRWLLTGLAVTILLAGGGVALISLTTFGDASRAETGTTDDGAAAGAEPDGTGTDSEGKAAEADAGQASEAGNSEGEEKKEGPDAVPVEIAQVESGPISSYLSTTANLEAENQAQIVAEIDGLVVDLLVEEGDRVARGEALARLDEGDRKIRLQKAALKVRNEKTNFDRGKRMFGDKLISQEEFDRIEYAYRVAQQEEEEAAYVLSRTEIVAPFDGVVSERMVNEGGRVKPADPLFSLVSYNPLVARIYLPEKDVLDLAADDDVMLALNAVGDTRFPGRISRISPVVDPATGTVKVTVEVTRIPDNVRPGSFVTVNIVRETHAEAVQIPRDAVIRDLEENFVYVVESGEAKKRRVELGFEENGHIEILSGLATGERIVTVGQGGLKDGTRVEIIEA